MPKFVGRFCAGDAILEHGIKLFADVGGQVGDFARATSFKRDLFHGSGSGSYF